jgi:hypothetical protein
MKFPAFLLATITVLAPLGAVSKSPVEPPEIRAVVQISQCNKPLGYVLISPQGDAAIVAVDAMSTPLYAYLLSQLKAGKIKAHAISVPCGTSI